MKLSISNIAWEKEQDETIYTLMQEYGFRGLEIAPTRVFSNTPYEHVSDAVLWAEYLKKSYGFVISSVQSIWYGRTESIFGSEKERLSLISYTKKAIDFAAAVDCKNLVFGCPRNRNIPDGKTMEGVIPFFREIADYAAQKNTVIGVEANPPIYNTNFINDTSSAIRLIKEVNSPGLKLNLDVGTMIYNCEKVDVLSRNVQLINHIHISEPRLNPIKVRPIHKELYKLLKEEKYNKFISIEMGKNDSIDKKEMILDYVKKIFS